MESIVIVLDVGKSMYQADEYKNSLIPSLSIVKSLVQRKLFTESKDELGLILCGSSKTKNQLVDNLTNNYLNIEIARELSRVNWEFLEYLNDGIGYHGVDNTDLLEAVIVASDHLVTKLRGRKITAGSSKRIIVISNLDCEINWSNLDSVSKSLQKEGIIVNVVSKRELPDDDKMADNVGFGSEELGARPSAGSSKMSPVMLMNENMFASFVRLTDGCSYSFEDALVDLNYFEPRSILNRGWKVNLEISDVFSVPVVGYNRVRETKLPSTKVVYGGDPEAEIESKVTYHLSSDDTATVMTDDVIKGFKYGHSVVPCTEEDISGMKLKVEKSLKLIGFTEEDSISPHLYVGDKSIDFVGETATGMRAVGALAHAMFEAGVVMVVRHVYSRASSPHLGVMSVRIKGNCPALVFREIAYGEDIRAYTFASLMSGPSDQSESGSSTTTASVSQTQLDAVDGFIDALMLTESSSSDPAREYELNKPTRMRNPSLQLFYQSLEARSRSGLQCELPGLREDLAQQLRPPKDRLPQLAVVLDNIIRWFPELGVESVSAGNKKKGETAAEAEVASKRQCVSTSSNGGNKENGSTGGVVDLADILRRTDSGSTEVGLSRPVSDFCALLERGGLERRDSTMTSMQRVIKKLRSQGGGGDIQKALSCLRELRRRSLEFARETPEMVERFNVFLQSFKGDAEDNPYFWNMLLKNDITLISVSESARGVSEKEKKVFLTNEAFKDNDSTKTDDEMEDLFDNM